MVQLSIYKSVLCKFSVTGLLCGEFTGYRWILRTKASAENCLRKTLKKKDVVDPNMTSGAHI